MRRLLPALLALVVFTTACQMNVDVTTTLNAGGDGRFSIVFSFDKKFIEVVSSTAEGRESLAQIRELGSAFEGSGWAVKTTKPDGGLRIAVDRTFTSPQDLQRALKGVEERSKQSLSFLNVFRDFTLDYAGGTLRTGGSVGGSVDLTTKRLAPTAETNPELEKVLKQAAGEVFRFTIKVNMPGRVGTYEGNPTRVEGGSVQWRAPFGEVSQFGAKASGFTPLGLGAIVLPIAAVMVIAGALMVRSLRRRKAPVPEGWTMTGEDDGDHRATSSVSTGNESADGDPGGDAPGS